MASQPMTKKQGKAHVVSDSEWRKAIDFRDAAIRRANDKDETASREVARKYAEAMHQMWAGKKIRMVQP